VARKRLTTDRQRTARKAGLTSWARNRGRKLLDCAKGGRARMGEGSAASLTGYEMAMKRWRGRQGTT